MAFAKSLLSSKLETLTRLRVQRSLELAATAAANAGQAAIAAQRRIGERGAVESAVAAAHTGSRRRTKNKVVDQEKPRRSRAMLPKVAKRRPVELSGGLSLKRYRVY